MPEIAFNVQDSGAKVLFFEGSLAERIPDAATCAHVDLGYSQSVMPSVGAEPFDVAAGVCVALLLRRDFDQETTAVILYTSGTTGKPKGAMLTQMSMVMSALHYEFCLGLNADDRALMAVPATHVTGLVAIMLSMVKSKGATIFQTVFKAVDFLALAAAERATYTLMVPAMYNLCLLQAELDEYDLSAWRVGGYGGSPMPMATVRRLAEKLPNLQLFNCLWLDRDDLSVHTITPLGESRSAGSIPSASRCRAATSRSSTMTGSRCRAATAGRSGFPAVMSAPAIGTIRSRRLPTSRRAIGIPATSAA